MLIYKTKYVLLCTQLPENTCLESLVYIIKVIQVAEHAKIFMRLKRCCCRYLSIIQMLLEQPLYYYIVVAGSATGTNPLQA